MVRPKDPHGIKSNAIISEVQKRPCLFDTNHRSYGDRAEKARNWEHVCASVVPGWASRSTSDKLSAGKEVQKRWRSIRDSYTKAYRQGKVAAGQQCAAGSRRYHHHRQMEFLLHALQNKKTRHPADKSESHSEMSSSPQPQPAEETPAPAPAPAPAPRAIQREELVQPLDLKTKPQTCDKATQTEAPLAPAALGRHLSAEASHFDDKAFATSLVPLFRDMDLHTKILCRIEVMKIIRYALTKHEHFKALRAAEDRFYEDSISGILSNPSLRSDSRTASTLSMTTRSADGSRPIRKRQSLSPSPPPMPAKRRGPGRPRKNRVPLQCDEPPRPSRRGLLRMNPAARGPRPSPLRVNPAALSPSSAALDDALNKATSVTQLSACHFMKVYNLGHSKDLAPAQAPGIQCSVKNEPVEHAP